MTHDLFDRWNQYRADGQPLLAHRLLLQALQDPALEQQAMACRGIEYCAAGRWGNAVLPLMQACMEPAEWAYHALLARTLSHLGRNDLAVSFLQHGLRRQPDSTQLRSVYWQAAAKVLPRAQLQQEARVFLPEATDPSEISLLQAVLGVSASGAHSATLSPAHAEGPAPSDQLTQAPSQLHVDILVPVFGGYQHTRRCLESLLAAQKLNKTPHTIIVLDDAGPEPVLTAYLKQLAEGGQVRLHRHAQNIGFINNVNYGMRLNPGHDVIWVNSDTAVHGNWLDRLHAAAYSQPRVGSVTPWSNNGELLSLSKPHASEPMPNPTDLARIDHTAQQLDGTPIEIPAGCGFCFYIPRAAIDEVGYLNSTDLRRGYGEETDWSMRARRMGYVQLAATNTFVGHEGGSSFGLEKSLRVFQNNGWIRRQYPDIDSWFETHPGKGALNVARQALQLARLPQVVAWANEQKPSLEVVPAFLASRFPAQGQARPVIRLAYAQAADGLEVLVQAPTSPGWGMSFVLPVQTGDLRQVLDAIIPNVVRVSACEPSDCLPAELRPLISGRAAKALSIKAIDSKRLTGKTWLIADQINNQGLLQGWLSLAERLGQQNLEPGSVQTFVCFIEPGSHAHRLRATGAAYILPRLEGLPLQEQVRLANVHGALTLGQGPQEHIFAQSVAGYCGLPLSALKISP